MTPGDYRAFLHAHRAILAPMAGVTDVAFRQLCVEQGAQLTFTEMVSSKALEHRNARTQDLLALAPNERLVGVQLFGHEPAVMASQAARVEELLEGRLAVIDLNMGCPARKIVSRGDGASLMERPDEARAVIEACAAAVRVPVTVKFRRGYAMGHETALEFAKMAEAAGAAAVTVHGRFAAQLYRGQADWGVVSRIVGAVGIPVVGNGDVTSGQAARARLEESGCDAVMVARGAQGNPWIFAQVAAALEGRPEPAAPTALQRVEMARRHAHALHEWEPRALPRMRKHASWYVHGLPGAAAARGALNACTALSDFDAVFDDLERRLREAGA